MQSRDRGTLERVPTVSADVTVGFSFHDEPTVNSKDELTVATFNREIDKFIESLRAQYGDQIPVPETFKLLQKLERATGETDTVNQP